MTNKNDYFETAQRWSDDRLGEAIIKARHFQVGFWVLVGSLVACAISFFVLIPMQHTQLVVVHQGPSGYVWLSTTKPKQIVPLNWRRTQSELAHYTRARMGFDPILYREQSDEVSSMNSTEMQSLYDHEQSYRNPQSPIRLLGKKGSRTVHVKNVLLLAKPDKLHPNRKNCAEINLSVTEHQNGQLTRTHFFTVLVSWVYRGVPSDPKTMLANWDGLTITKFVVQPINV